MSSEETGNQDGSSEQREIREELRQDPWLGTVLDWNNADADRHIREGISVDLATHLQSLLDLNNKEAAQLLLGRSRSTYSRYRNERRLLQGAKAERTVRFARILALAADTVGSIEEAIKWMREPVYGLGGERPIELAETEPGARMVRNVLHRAQHGILS
jgi:putative toxin-antitoxin system antitoxin component (TIGR02293 family)